MTLKELLQPLPRLIEENAGNFKKSGGRIFCQMGQECMAFFSGGHMVIKIIRNGESFWLTHCASAVMLTDEAGCSYGISDALATPIKTALRTIPERVRSRTGYFPEPDNAPNITAEVDLYLKVMTDPIRNCVPAVTPRPKERQQ